MTFLTFSARLLNAEDEREGRSPKGFDTRDLKEAKALLEELVT
jgi:hypothetical protein